MIGHAYDRAALLWAIALLGLCAAHGASAVSGLTYPPDLDSLRDLGFAQGILNGDFFGDPAYLGEIRWYPPLVPVLAAASFKVVGNIDLLKTWVQAGPWINLLTPATFFVSARQLFGANIPAVLALTVFVLFDGTVSRPWVTGGYTPWPLIPCMSQSLFFVSLSLILARRESRRWLDAVLIGAAVGITFLAHPVPAILLTFIVMAVAFGVRGVRLQTLLWLSVVAVVQLTFTAPYLLPIALHYPDGIANPSPGLWTDEFLKPRAGMVARAFLINLPGILALVGIGFSYRRRVRLDRGAAFALAAWIIPCVVVLSRHYGCGVGGSIVGFDVARVTACRFLAMPVHHYHLYLQTAWAMLIGFVSSNGLLLLLRRNFCYRVGLVAVGIAVSSALCARFLLHHGYDFNSRSLALSYPDGGEFLDTEAYHWIMANTKPSDTFATPLSLEDWGDPAAFAVYAAGRKLVALPLMHSNPYVLWRPRDEMRRTILEAVTQPGSPKLICVSPQSQFWLLLPRDTAVDQTRVENLYTTSRYNIYRIRNGLC